MKKLKKILKVILEIIFGIFKWLFEYETMLIIFVGLGFYHMATGNKLMGFYCAGTFIGIIMGRNTNRIEIQRAVNLFSKNHRKHRRRAREVQVESEILLREQIRKEICEEFGIGD